MSAPEVATASLDERLKFVSTVAEDPAGAQGQFGLPSFGFQFAGLPFQAELLPGDRPLVRLAAELGPLPYTVEAPLQRHWMLRIIAASKNLERGCLAVGDDGVVRLTAETAPPGDSGPVGVLAAVTALLLDFKPHLDVLAEIMAAFPARRRRVAFQARPA